MACVVQVFGFGGLNPKSRDMGNIETPGFFLSDRLACHFHQNFKVFLSPFTLCVVGG
jgi:hypothetical protein